MLPLSHVEVFPLYSSNTVVKCSFTSSIRPMTRNNESHQVGQFILAFFHLDVSGTRFLYMITIANALFTVLLCCGAVSKNLHNQSRSMYEAT